MIYIPLHRCVLAVRRTRALNVVNQTSVVSIVDVNVALHQHKFSLHFHYLGLEYAPAFACIYMYTQRDSHADRLCARVRKTARNHIS